jgi:hypothetical protein
MSTGATKNNKKKSNSNVNVAPQSQTPPTSPPYVIEIVGAAGNGTNINYLTSPSPPDPTPSSGTGGTTGGGGFASGTGASVPSGATVESGGVTASSNSVIKTPAFLPYSELDIRQSYATSQVWPQAAAPANETNPQQQTNNNGTPPAQTPNANEIPLDPRLIYVVDPDGGSVIYSYTSNMSIQAALVDGFIVNKDGQSETASNPKVTVDDVKQYTEFYGVPSLMNYNAYINLQGAGGKFGNKYLIDRENQPKWYDITAQGNKAGVGGEAISSMGELKVADLVDWSNQPENVKFPYRYQDFVFLKWWKKIPLNYMITLRRYTFPVLDSVGSAEEEKGEIKKANLTPAATAITFLGDDTGNKISSILGPIEASLKWKDIKAAVWEVSFSGSPASADSPFPGLAKALGFLASGPAGAKPQAGGPPPDPYNNGPYSNKILGPINVIESTKARDRGLEFKHSISLVFEYSARSIGGINSKAAMLDILGNLMILTYNEAAFWGGMNRHMPQGAGGNLDPFLGGPAGRKAWLRGQPDEFFKAVSDQFSKALENVGDAFAKFLDNPMEGLKSLASGAASSYMKLKTSGGQGFMQGMHSLLTGNPVGEWHVTVGNPLNPMMMIGNLICTNIKIEFNDELGPDDFPTELKATITLDHGMPRDRAGIESMFNKGRGRLYSLPKGYEESFSAVSQSAIDTSLGPDRGITPWASPSEIQAARNGTQNGGGSRGYNGGRKNPLLGDPQVIDNIFGYFKQSTVPKVRSTTNMVYSHGVKYLPAK